MFLRRWIGALLAMPLLLAGRAAGMFKVPAAAGLLTAAWYVSGRGSDGRLALATTQQFQGGQAAREKAARWMATRPRPEIAAYAGLLALENGDAEAAKAYLERGNELGDDCDGLLDFLEYMIAAGSPDQPASEVARRFEKRRDLPAMLSRMVAVELLWADMLGGRFQQARGRAGHLLEIADTPDAEMALWALAVRDGHVGAADAHFRRAATAASRRTYLQGLALAAIGRTDEARAMLAEIEQANPPGAAQLRRLLDGSEGGA